LRQTVEDSVPTLNGFPPLPFIPTASPDHVPPGHAAALGGVEPVQMSGDQLRKLLVSSARKVEILPLCRCAHTNSCNQRDRKLLVRLPVG
jgi:hypothetical protein